MTTLRQIAVAAEAQLSTAENLLVLVGGVPDDAEIPRDDDGLADPYAVLWQGGGQVRADRHGGIQPLGDNVHLDLTVPLQITAAAGTYDGALWAVDQVRAAFTGVRLFDNAQTTRLREITDPGPIRKDEDVPSDVRWYLPMQYRFTTTT